MKSPYLSAVFFVAVASAVSMIGGSADAQLYDPCPYTNDGDCDEPEGLNLCAEGTDVADCSNPNSNFGFGAGFGQTGGGLLNPCPYTNDGDCDEPEGLNLCAEGTDVADCSNPNSNFGTGTGFGQVGGGALLNPCPTEWLNDGDCDEPEGLNLCAEGTDVADCSNPNSFFGGGPGFGAVVPGTPGGAAGTSVVGWVRLSNDPRTFATQPGRVMPIGDIQSGWYTVYTGNAGNGGGPITGIYNYDYEFVSEGHYAMALASGNEQFSIEAFGEWNLYPNPGTGMSRVYARNDSTQSWRAICILPRGTPVAQCGN
jgi:hypothetical protein